MIVRTMMYVAVLSVSSLMAQDGKTIADLIRAKAPAETPANPSQSTGVMSREAFDALRNRETEEYIYPIDDFRDYEEYRKWYEQTNKDN